MFTSSGVSLPRSIKRESASSGLFEGAIGVIGPAEGGLSASTAHGVASFHVSTSRLTTTPGSESGARCTNLAGITRAGKRMDPKLADLSEASERRSFTSGGSLGRTRARGEETRGGHQTRWETRWRLDGVSPHRCGGQAQLLLMASACPPLLLVAVLLVLALLVLAPRAPRALLSRAVLRLVFRLRLQVPQWTPLLPSPSVGSSRSLYTRRATPTSSQDSDDR